MKILNGPYLQDPQKDAISILWETDAISSGQVLVYDSFHPHAPAKNHPIRGDARVFYSGSGTFHKVSVQGLAAGTDYYYQVISHNEGNSVASEIFSFRTAPEKDTPFSFVITSEHGGTLDETQAYTAQILELIRRERPDFIQSVGDILSDGRVNDQWNFWLFEPFRTLLQNTPFYPCVGNHETGGENAVKDSEIATLYANYEKYFLFPRNYSFDYGCAHFCVLDCPTMFEEIRRSEEDVYQPILKENFRNREAYRFLEQDLAASDARWKFVVFHYPPYTSAIWEVPELRIFAPLFERYDVDIVFNSHAIVYERSHPLKGGKPDKDGVRYILTGGFGDFDDWFWDKTNGRSAKIAARPNYVRVAVTPWSLELQAIDYEGKLFDTLNLEK